MSIKQKVFKNPKITVSLVMTIVTALYSIFGEYAALAGFSTKTIAIVSMAVMVLSLLYDKFYDEKESVFGKGYKAYKDHIGTRPKNPPK